MNLSTILAIVQAISQLAPLEVQLVAQVANTIHGKNTGTTAPTLAPLPAASSPVPTA